MRVMWSPSVCISGRQCARAASSLLGSAVTKQEGAEETKSELMFILNVYVHTSIRYIAFCCIIGILSLHM